MGNYYNNKNRQHMFHTVYDSFESKPHGRDYLGKHSSDNPYDKYKGSFRDESFDPDTKIVLGYSKTVEGAVWLEMQLQRVFRVAEDPQFANRSYQTSVGFSFSWEGMNHSEETRLKQREVKLGKKHSEGTCQKLSELNSGENHPQYGTTPSEKTRRKIGDALRGRKQSEEVISQKREITLGRKWWVHPNGDTRFQIDCPGPGWVEGRNTPGDETRRRMREAKVGKSWWVNSAGEIQLHFDCPGPGWQRGRKWKEG